MNRSGFARESLFDRGSPSPVRRPGLSVLVRRSGRSAAVRRRGAVGRRAARRGPGSDVWGGSAVLATHKNGRLPVVEFRKLGSVMPMPNLLDVQRQAFETLLRTDAAAKEREDVGLERVFREIFPITDVNEKFSLEFVSYTLGEPKYSVEECIERDMTYAAPLKATLRLIVWEDVEDGERRPKDIIETDVYLGDLPLLTELGTFIISGAERVIVSQLHRSPGVVFEETVHPN